MAELKQRIQAEIVTITLLQFRRVFPEHRQAVGVVRGGQGKPFPTQVVTIP